MTAIRTETERVKTFALDLPHPTRHLAGQHFVVRLTAPDGYTAQRSYSVASPPDDGTSIELTVERLAEGEVSGFLHDELVVGDTVEVRGPIGGWFVWDGATPALLIGGGSGVVPLMAMLRLARRTPQQTLAHLLVSYRGPTETDLRGRTPRRRHHRVVHATRHQPLQDLPGGSPSTTSVPTCVTTPPCTSAAPRGLPRPPPNEPWKRGSPLEPSGSNASDRPVDSLTTRTVASDVRPNRARSRRHRAGRRQARSRRVQPTSGCRI